jgi:hypothetical protein
MKQLALTRKTNIRFMNEYKVEKQYLRYYQKTFAYKHMMLKIAWVEMWREIWESMKKGFRKGNQ